MIGTHQPAPPLPPPFECLQARAPPVELVCSHPDASLVNAAARRAQQLSQARPCLRGRRPSRCNTRLAPVPGPALPPPP